SQSDPLCRVHAHPSPGGGRPHWPTRNTLDAGDRRVPDAHGYRTVAQEPAGGPRPAPRGGVRVCVPRLADRRRGPLPTPSNRYSARMNLPALQSFMRESRIDAWLLYDFRGNNPVLAQLIPGKRWTTRRVFALIPARGTPIVLAHGIDFSQFGSLA